MLKTVTSAVLFIKAQVLSDKTSMTGYLYVDAYKNILG